MKSYCSRIISKSFNQSSLQAFYFFEIVSIDNIVLDSEDWVGVFNGDVCVGSRKWDISLCEGGVCDLPAMGDDGEEYTIGYMQNNDVSTFKIYDYSEEAFYDAIPSQNSPWANNGLFYIDNLNVYPNPTRGLFNISFVSEKINNVEITVIDAFGKIIILENKQHFVGEYTKQVDLSTSPKGIYMVQIRTNDSFVSKRIVVQ